MNGPNPRVFLTGAAGQVGRALARSRPAGAELLAFDSSQLDITDRDAVQAAVEQARPDLVLNAAAYTAVDQAEADRDRAYAVNRDGAAHLASAARAAGARILQLSTDFVFDGAQGEPYSTKATCRPLGVYGASKRAGEDAVLEAGGEAALILRTSWVYAAAGKNFVLTILGLLRQQPELRVVADQVGSPTWAAGLAEALWAAVALRNLAGIHHWCDAGVASWYDFAVAIQEEAMSLNLLERPVPIRPIRTAEYPTPAARPPYSVLDTSLTRSALAMEPRHWRVNLRAMLAELRAS